MELTFLKYSRRGKGKGLEIILRNPANGVKESMMSVGLDTSYCPVLWHHTLPQGELVHVRGEFLHHHEPVKAPFTLQGDLQLLEA